MAETIIVMPCCAGKSRQPNSTIPFRYVQTKVQSFSNWGNHNRKLESVCRRYKMPENTTGTQTYRSLPQNGRSKSRFRNFKVVLNSTPTTDFLLIEWSQCTWLSTFIKATAFHYSYFRYLDYPAQSLPVQKTDSALFE